MARLMAKEGESNLEAFIKASNEEIKASREEAHLTLAYLVIEGAEVQEAIDAYADLILPTEQRRRRCQGEGGARKAEENHAGQGY
ncbi:unnamed protein product [Vitrella brassicaformis CCMP3155]|uniref:Uncharacterized protein n=1 Tax=Vitrella brassicaformis (strain CCMP3155) TaxID=1169540 RepID=A0A0G4FI96_VITBC|nr:unnamed protein product [Vitrella brassicaformis CCMP3155]|eukprot:CEM13199.1 unnamed protein product [Vitrella brassicaformis CCMP3155]